jgi:hypothetical protein
LPGVKKSAHKLEFQTKASLFSTGSQANLLSENFALNKT